MKSISKSLKAMTTPSRLSIVIPILLLAVIAAGTVPNALAINDRYPLNLASPSSLLVWTSHTVLGNLAGPGLAQWVPYVPASNQVTIDFKGFRDVTVQVSVQFTSSCYRVSDWGAVSMDQSVLRVNAMIETMPPPAICAQIVWSAYHNYTISALPDGVYVYEFHANGQLVKTANFSVPIPEFLEPQILVFVVLVASVLATSGRLKSGRRIERALRSKGQLLLSHIDTESLAIKIPSS